MLTNLPSTYLSYFSSASLHSLSHTPISQPPSPAQMNLATLTGQTNTAYNQQAFNSPTSNRVHLASSYDPTPPPPPHISESGFPNRHLPISIDARPFSNKKSGTPNRHPSRRVQHKRGTNGNLLCLIPLSPPHFDNSFLPSLRYGQVIHVVRHPSQPVAYKRRLQGKQTSGPSMWKMIADGGEGFPDGHRWFSGRMLACHAGDPGSIPGRCNHLLQLHHQHR